MEDAILDLRSVVVLSEQVTPITCPITSEIGASQFYNSLKESIDKHCLPVDCLKRKAQMDDTSQRDLLVLSLRDGETNLLRILVGYENFGRLIYVNRKYVLLPPLLLTARRETLSELPPRITLDSRELPPHETSFSDNIIDGRFKSERHKARVWARENRRVERWRELEKRFREQARLLDEWLQEVDKALDLTRHHPQWMHFKDSVDTMITTTIEELFGSDAAAREAREQTQKDEELKARAKTIWESFF